MVRVDDREMTMATDIVGSNMPSKNGYGQNGDKSPSSDRPGQNTTSGFLPAVTVPTDPWQTRDVGKSGMAAKAPGAKK
jgi:hypothetical protein